MIDIKKLRYDLSTLSVYRDIRKEPLIVKLAELIKAMSDDLLSFETFTEVYCDFINILLAYSKEACFEAFIVDKILFSENSFSLSSGKSRFKDLSVNLVAITRRDLKNLEAIAKLSPDAIKAFALKIFEKDANSKELIEALPEWKHMENCMVANPFGTVFFNTKGWDKNIEALADFYFSNGCGIYARYKAFIWERDTNGGFLRGLSETDPVKFSDLIGYELERGQVIENTLQLLNHYPANNMLLYGDRGTGKSTTIKALLNEFSEKGLRIIEIPKESLGDFHKILQIIKDKPQKFIAFIDDLAFEDNEEHYTALKAVLEGSLECKPNNLLIYATSNRRHLVKEKFSDRVGLGSLNKEDEVRAYDTMQEKLSLADRFGITVTFSSPDKRNFLEIVEGLAKKRGLEIETDKLHKEALKWEIHYNGRSPRTARQFIDWLEGSLPKGI